jgi:hypothetical protein
MCVLSLLLNLGLELEFENQLDHFVELVDMLNFDFWICIYV